MAAEGDDELEQAKARLRRHGYKVERLRNERRAARAKPSDILLEPQKLEAELRQAGYGTGEYEHDKAIVKAAYLAAAGTIGASIIERMETIILEMREHYLGAGAPEEDRLTELVTAVRDWLPFVSVSGYIALYDQGGVLPPLVREAGLPPVARLGHLAAMPQASAMPSLEEAPRPDNSKFLPWRAFDDTYEEAPRRTVLAKSDAVSERALRNALYTDHPVLLLLPKVSTPEEIETLLARSSEERAYLLQQLVTEIVAYLEQTVVALRDGLRPDDALDWNRLDPLLIWAGGMLTEDEAKTSYLHVLMEDLREEVKPWTITDTLTLASVVIAIAITVASWGAAGPMAAVIAAIDVSVAVTDLTVSLYVASNENQLREKLNRFAHVDAALGVAISPESPGLTLLLGLLGLTASGAGFVSAARRAALQRTMAKAAEREAARFGGITRFRVEDSPPLPSTRPDAPSPQAAPPSPSPSSAKPGPSTAKTGSMADEAVERVDLPSTSAAKPEPPSVKGEALQPEPEPAPAQAKRPSATSPRFVDEVGEQQDSLLKRLTDDGGDVASPEAMADFIAALQRSRQMGVAGAADEGLAELQAALERGLARLAARNPVAWERLLDDAWRAGGTKAVEDVFNNTRRGTARLAGADPDGAAAREASRLNMQKRLEQRSREASIASARDTASRIDPLERATSNPADLRGTTFTGGTKDAVIGSRGTVQSAGKEGAPIIIGDNYHIMDFDKVTAETGGIERIVIMPSREDGSRLSITIEGRVLPERIDRKNYNSSSKLMGNKDLGLEVGEYELAHAWGAGFGDEAAGGITMAPRDINQVAQNRYIEKWIRDAARRIDAEKGVVRLRVEATTWDMTAADIPAHLKGGDFLRRVTYEVEISLPGRPVARVNVSVYAGKPPDNVIKDIEFDNSALKGFGEADLDAYRRYLFNRQTDEMQRAEYLLTGKE